MALAEIGRIDEGISTIQSGIDLCVKFGALFRLSTLYNCLGYCYGEIHHHPTRAWAFNLKAEQMTRQLMKKHPSGRRQYAEVAARAASMSWRTSSTRAVRKKPGSECNLQKKESRSPDFDMNRHQWESRMNYLAAQILLTRGDLAQVEPFIQQNLEIVRRLHAKKREGGFLRLLGEVQMRRGADEEALQSFNEAIPLLQEVGNPRQLWQAHGSLATTHEKCGRLSEAKEHWGLAAEVIRRM